MNPVRLAGEHDEHDDRAHVATARRRRGGRMTRVHHEGQAHGERRAEEDAGARVGAVARAEERAPPGAPTAAMSRASPQAGAARPRASSAPPAPWSATTPERQPEHDHGHGALPVRRRA